MRRTAGPGSASSAPPRCSSSRASRRWPAGSRRSSGPATSCSSMPWRRASPAARTSRPTGSRASGRARVDRLLVALRALQRAALLAGRRRRGGALVALPRPRAESLPATRRLRLVLRDDLSRRCSSRPPFLRATVFRRARASPLAPVATRPQRSPIAAGAVERRLAARRRLDLARAARLDRLGAPARAAELPARPAVVAGRPGTRVTRRGLLGAPGAAARSAACSGSSGTTGRRPGGPTRCPYLGWHQDFRNARARLSRLSSVRARSLRDVPLAPRAPRPDGRRPPVL